MAKYRPSVSAVVYSSRAWHCIDSWNRPEGTVRIAPYEILDRTGISKLSTMRIGLAIRLRMHWEEWVRQKQEEAER